MQAPPRKRGSVFDALFSKDDHVHLLPAKKQFRLYASKLGYSRTSTEIQVIFEYLRSVPSLKCLGDAVLQQLSKTCQVDRFKDSIMCT